MDNIFEGAKFGDAFLTRDGRTAVVVNVNIKNGTLQLFIENEFSPTAYEIRCNGWANCYEDEPDYKWRTDVDIVSRYQEQIDEKKLDELAHNHCMNSGYSGIDDNDYINDETLTWGDIMKDIKRAYKAGYHKAKEE